MDAGERRVVLAPLLLCHTAEAATTTTAGSSRPRPRPGPRRGRVTASTTSTAPLRVFDLATTSTPSKSSARPLEHDATTTTVPRQVPRPQPRPHLGSPPEPVSRLRTLGAPSPDLATPSSATRGRAVSASPSPRRTSDPDPDAGLRHHDDVVLCPDPYRATSTSSPCLAPKPKAMALLHPR